MGGTQVMASRAGVDCAPDGGGVLAATRDDGNLREALAHFPDDRRRVLLAATLTTLAPAMILVATSSSKVTTVRTTGISMLVEISRTSSMLVGE